MGRNYKKELKWRKEKYDEIRASIDKNLGLELKKKLKEENKSIAKWISENAYKYLNND